jgi:lipid-A-disaccharide synthase
VKRDPLIFITVAEASGDRHAAGLVRAIKQQCPGARFIGAGGPLLAAEGMEILTDMTRQASMLGGPLLKLRYYHRNVKLLSKAIREHQPDIVVPVDSPALNWHIAKAARKAGCPVMYYVAPQVWAWAPWRIRKIRKFTDHVACLLPFEEAYFRSRDVAATFVGHPLFDHLPSRPERLPDIDAAAQTGQWRVALLAGSRPAEIVSHAPALAAVAKAINARWPEARCVLTAPHAEAAANIRKAIGECELPIEVGRTAEVLADCHFAVATSGTVTLEAAWYGVPMVIIYKAWMLGYHLLAKHLIRTPHLSLVNILAGGELVPELMPWNGDVDKLVMTTLAMMEDTQRLKDVRQELLSITKPLHDPARRACDRTAELVLSMIP